MLLVGAGFAMDENENALRRQDDVGRPSSVLRAASICDKAKVYRRED